jgi:hypothetical protein
MKSEFSEEDKSENHFGFTYVPLGDGSTTSGTSFCYKALSEWWQCKRSQQPPLSVWQKYGKSSVSVLLYYLIGFCFFKYRHDWTIIDSVYFSTVLMMTVGYGDEVPEGDLGFLFTAVYALLAVTLVAAAVGQLWKESVKASVVVKMMDYRREQRQRISRDLTNLSIRKPKLHQRLSHRLRKTVGRKIRALLKPDQSIALLDKEAHVKRTRNIWVASIAAFMFWVFVGTVVNAELQDLPAEGWKGSRLIKGFYFSVITLTTVGFGDFTPKTRTGKVFAILYILIGVPVSVNALGKVVNCIFGDDDDDEGKNVDLVKGLDQKKLQTMLEFQTEMQNAGCGNDVNGEVSRYEFMMFVLVRNGIVEMDTMEAIMHNFDELDLSASGVLAADDLQLNSCKYQSKASEV